MNSIITDKESDIGICESCVFNIAGSSPSSAKLLAVSPLASPDP